MSYDVIITAAGTGSRFGSEKNKVFVKLDGKPIIIYSLETFLADVEVEHIYITLTIDDMDEMRELILFYQLDFHKITLVLGGDTRQKSVFEALKKVRSYDVFIHDGARPLIQLEDIEKLKYALRFDDGAILAHQATDTVKEVNAAMEVNRTIDRKKVYLAQTPQAFRTDKLLKANELALEEHFEASDDASIIEYKFDFYVKVIEGKRTNIKITYPEDLIYAEAILSARKEGIEHV